MGRKDCILDQPSGINLHLKKMHSKNIWVNMHASCKEFPPR